VERVLVKICGLMRPEDARAAADAGADLVGFVFVPGTPRALDPEAVSWIGGVSGVETVGVFRDQPLEWILELRRALDLDWVQVHGSEPEAYVDRLGPRLLRRVPLTDPVDWPFVRNLGRHPRRPRQDVYQQEEAPLQMGIWPYSMPQPAA